MPDSWRPLIAGVGVVGRVHDVRPVDERRDARVDALERAPQVGGVDVVGPVVRRELVEDVPEVGDQRVVRGARPDRRLPGVAVGVDEARDDDVAVGVDDLRVVGRTGSGRRRRCCRPRRGRRRSAAPRAPSSWVRTMPPLISVRSLIVCLLLCAATDRPRRLAVDSVPSCRRRPRCRVAQVRRPRRSPDPPPPAAAAASMTARFVAAWGTSSADAAGQVGDEPQVLGGEVERERDRRRLRARGTPRACSRRTAPRPRWRPGRRRRPSRSIAGRLGQDERLRRAPR